MALVKNKFKGKGKGKGGGDKQSGGKNAMDVDKPVCHECGSEEHFVRDCPARAEKMAAKAAGKGNKGKGKGDKGKGKGKYGGVPNLSIWNSYYPGPSPTTWKSWYPSTNGKANLFEAPYQLSSFQQPQQPEAPQNILKSLFTGGNCFKIVEKGSKPKDPGQAQKSFTHVNTFLALQQEDETDEEEAPVPAPVPAPPTPITRIHLKTSVESSVVDE